MTDQELDKRITAVFFNIACAIFVFILYGSLLPFNLVGAPPGSFMDILLSTPLDTSQGQWISHFIFNLLLIFFVCGYCQLSKNKMIWPIMYALIISFGVLIEYLQMYFGGRGTSLVDIYANFGGIFIGTLLWIFFGKFMLAAVEYLLKEKSLSIYYIRKLYLAFVIIIILFPFDFYMNDLQMQMAYITKGMPLFASDTNGQMGLLSIFSSILLLLPLGVFYRISLKKYKLALILKFAFILLLLEIVQFFEVSGQSSLLSFINKFIGFYAGYYLGQFIKMNSLLSALLRLKNVFLISAPLYIWLVLNVKGFSLSQMGSLTEISAIIKDMSLLPFANYINVSSGGALLSFILNFSIYVPIGAYLALYRLSKGKIYHRRISTLAVTGMIIAMWVETIVLIWGLKMPDVTNIFLAMAGLPMGYYLIIMVNNASVNNSVVRNAQSDE